MPINYKEYPDNWLTEIRPAVLARAENKCEECGVANQAIIKRWPDGRVTYPNSVEWEMINNRVKNHDYSFTQAIKKYGFTRVVLTIAHLDHDKENEKVPLDRLRAWCQKCHLGYDMPIHVNNRKYGKKHIDNNYKLEFID